MVVGQISPSSVRVFPSSPSAFWVFDHDLSSVISDFEIFFLISAASTVSTVETRRLTKYSTEASRAKHKFAVKRNSWPKTRGVAMNPVDHPHGGVSTSVSPQGDVERRWCLTILYRVTINTLVRRRRCRGTPPRVKRRVSLPQGGLVCCVVPRRRRIKAFNVFTSGLGFIGLHWSFLGL